jgi:hypothetical protein
MPQAFPYINPIDGKFYFLHNATDIKAYTFTDSTYSKVSRNASRPVHIQCVARFPCRDQVIQPAIQHRRFCLWRSGE